MNRLKCFGICMLFLLFLGCFLPGSLQAQIGPPPEENVPIDGGASLLAAAGVAYGVKKYRDFRKNSSDQEDDM